LTRAGRFAIRSAQSADLARLGRLYEQAGFGLRLAGVVGFARARLDGEVVVAEVDDDLAGAAAGALFGGTGWVGGVAVVPAHRRVGLGGALTERIIGFLEGGGAATVLLHATALGRPVYERLGFVPETAYLTLTGPAAPRSAAGRRVRPGHAADLAAVLALDQAATAEDRRRLLAALWPSGGLLATGDGEPLGYHLASPWRSGGATIAADPQTGLALLAAAHRGHGDEVSISVPAANGPAVQALEAVGYRERYRTVRMHRGPQVAWRPAAVFGAHNLFWG
jgi:GNAT superfamily N-acetyltransferase